jgi:hypothetical protein
LSLVTLLGIVGVFVLGAANAEAITFDFCGTSTNPVLLSGSTLPNDRCADSTDRQWSYVRSYPDAQYSTCAIVKQYSNGGGGNISSPACGTPGPGGYEQTTCTCAGYGTITDGGSSVGWYHGFGMSP